MFIIGVITAWFSLFSCLSVFAEEETCWSAFWSLCKIPEKVQLKEPGFILACSVRAFFHGQPPEVMQQGTGRADPGCQKFWMSLWCRILHLPLVLTTSAFTGRGAQIRMWWDLFLGFLLSHRVIKEATELCRPMKRFRKHVVESILPSLGKLRLWHSEKG